MESQEQVKNESPKAFGFSLPPSLVERVEKVAQSTERSNSWHVKKALEEYLPQHESDRQNPTTAVPQMATA